MNFEDFEARFVKNNRYLVVMLISSLFLSGMCTFLLYSKERYFVFTSGEIFKERALSEQVCLESFKSIIIDEPNSQIVSDAILEILKDSPFTLEVDDVLKLNSLEKNRCQIIVKSKSKLRSFKIEMIESDEYPFFYKLNAIDETILKEGEV
jgi:hypothetical protein